MQHETKYEKEQWRQARREEFDQAWEDEKLRELFAEHRNHRPALSFEVILFCAFVAAIALGSFV